MSPIKGMTDQPRLPRLGKIHLGEKVDGTNGPRPVATEYFVMPEEIKAVYGQTPTSLDIMFPVDDPEVFASQYYRAYSSSRGLMCRGDGETAIRLIDSATKRGAEGTGEIRGELPNAQAVNVEWLEDQPCLGQACQYYKKKQCREVMMLQFLLPTVPGLGIWQLDTSSYYSIMNVNATLEIVRSVFGRIAGIPLILSLVPMDVAPDGRKKTIRVLSLGSRETINDLVEARRQGPLALPVPVVEGVPGLLARDIPEMTAEAAGKRFLAAAQRQPTPEDDEDQRLFDALGTPPESEGDTPNLGGTTPDPADNATVGDLMTMAIRPRSSGGLGFENTAQVCRALEVEKPAEVLTQYGKIKDAWTRLIKISNEAHRRAEAAVAAGAQKGG